MLGRVSDRERLGILGGTFDPVHVGHIVAAVDVRAALGLDRVLMVPAGDPWQKRGQVVASPEQRCTMAQRACAGLEGVEVSLEEELPPADVPDAKTGDWSHPTGCVVSRRDSARPGRAEW